MVSDQTFEGNRLPEDIDDLFGFAAVADRVSSAILEQMRSQCFVLGLEGEWGSGKSSLLAMLQRRLELRKASVVRFEPWMVGPREALIPELLKGLDLAIEALEGPSIAAKAESISKRFRRYSSGVSALGRLAGLAAIAGVPGAGLAEKALEKTALGLKEGLGDKPLALLKKKSSEALEELSNRIVVLIDDIDRLEPKEAVEVLRLVQSVADFPNVTYVLCYDRARLAESVTKVTGLEDGAAFLEKIVQVVFPVPQPQRAFLRLMFISRLRDITGRSELDERLSKILLNHIGPRVRTPRAIVRALDGLRILWPALAGEVDLADLVWLQFVRSEDPQLYRWIEQYVGEIFELSISYSERGMLQTRFEISLDKLLAPRNLSGLDWQEVRSFLPMVLDSSHAIEGSLFTRLPTNEALIAYGNKRLKSPDHARLYFGLIRPDGAMSDGEMSKFLENCVNPVQASKIIINLSQSLSHSGITKLEFIVDQITIAVDRMSADQIQGLIKGLLLVVDEIIAESPVVDRNVFRQSLGKMMQDLQRTQDEDVWSNWLRDALEKANATSFFTNEFKIESGVPNLAWGAKSQSDVMNYLARNYGNEKPIKIVSSRHFDRLMAIWRAADRNSYDSFLTKVFFDDLLFSEVIKSIQRSDQSFGFDESTYAILFSRHVSDYFSLTETIQRLEDLSNSKNGNNHKMLSKALFDLKLAEPGLSADN